MYCTVLVGDFVDGAVLVHLTVPPLLHQRETMQALPPVEGPHRLLQLEPEGRDGPQVG